MRRALLLLAACSRSDDPAPAAKPPPPAVAADAAPAELAPARCADKPSLPVDHFATVRRDLPPGPASPFTRSGDTLVVDAGACPYAARNLAQPLGSTWVLVHPLDAGRCEVWVGGETESPDYDGKPSAYCVLARSGGLAIHLRGSGGPPPVVCCP